MLFFKGFIFFSVRPKPDLDLMKADALPPLLSSYLFFFHNMPLLTLTQIYYRHSPHDIHSLNNCEQLHLRTIIRIIRIYKEVFNRKELLIAIWEIPHPIFPPLPPPASGVYRSMWPRSNYLFFWRILFGLIGEINHGSWFCLTLFWL